MGSAPSGGMEMDIIVERTCTVKEVSGKKNVHKLSFKCFYSMIVTFKCTFTIINFALCSVFKGDAGCHWT